jgi:DNA (cytosine-5)-methyltransferase 1
MTWTFAEFFAGGGMARQGFGSEWRCVLANDNHPGKTRAYVYNHGKDHFHYGPVAKLTPADVPGMVDCGWSSSPCQDVSLAGARAGLSGKRSSAFWDWWRLVEELNVEGRAFRILALENVPGLLSSNDGADIAAVRQAYESEGYVCEIVKINARHFVPQSRDRVFAIGVRREFGINLASYVARAIEALPKSSNQSLADVLEPAPCHPAVKTAEILSLMEPVHLAKIEEARRAGRWVIGAYSIRGRKGADGKLHSRAEVRFDVASAFRTIGGGSSRQGLIAVNGAIIRTRLFTPREAARAMGLPDSYRLPTHIKDALSLIGDGVSPPVVRHLAEHVLEPILAKVRGTSPGRKTMGNL